MDEKIIEALSFPIPINERMPAGKEKKRELKTYEISRRCGKHGCKGNLVFTGLTFTTMPPYFRNKCDVCGSIYDLDKSYPFIEHK